MNILDIIEKKKTGTSLSKEEIEYAIGGFLKDDIKDYQMAALLMAIYFKGMTKDETYNLTMTMVNSGEVVNFRNVNGMIIDKHSSGGVGDKVSLVALPLAAAAGVKIGKMSGRGLGFTGGTVDKLESIPGFNTSLPMDDFMAQVEESGMALMGQTKEIAVADKFLYALRSATSTVNSLPLIVSSIMSKKIASGADGVVLDVTYGSGAFMKTLEDAEELGSVMVNIGRMAGMKTAALFTSMEEPLGTSVGNGIEVIEAHEILKGNREFNFDNKLLTSVFLSADYPFDVETVAVEVAAEMAYMAGKFSSIEEAIENIKLILESKKALHCFYEMIENQGGNLESLKNNYDLIFSPKHIFEMKSREAGYVGQIPGDRVGMASLCAGAGRKNKSDLIDYNAGIVLPKKVGKQISVGEPIFRLFGNSEKKLEEAMKILEDAYIIYKEKPAAKKIIGGRIGG